MSTNNFSSINETGKMFISESDKVKRSIEETLTNVKKLSMKEIIELYYQIINVNSLLKFLKLNFEDSKENKTLLDIMHETERYVDERFNVSLHPLLKSQLKKSLENSRESLKNMRLNQNKKTKDEIENQAKEYDNLRQIMSAREFIEQYDKTLEN